MLPTTVTVTGTGPINPVGVATTTPTTTSTTTHTTPTTTTTPTTHTTPTTTSTPTTHTTPTTTSTPTTHTTPTTTSTTPTTTHTTPTTTSTTPTTTRTTPTTTSTTPTTTTTPTTRTTPTTTTPTTAPTVRTTPVSGSGSGKGYDGNTYSGSYTGSYATGDTRQIALSNRLTPITATYNNGGQGYVSGTFPSFGNNGATMKYQASGELVRGNCDTAVAISECYYIALSGDTSQQLQTGENRQRIEVYQSSAPAPLFPVLAQSAENLCSRARRSDVAILLEVLPQRHPDDR